MSLWPSRAHSTSLRRQHINKNRTSRRAKLSQRGCESLESRLLLTADLSITKQQIAPLTAGVPSAVVPGEIISYQITVNNNGGTAATNALLTDALPVGETLIDSSTSTGATLSSIGNTLTGNLGTINAGGSETITVDALVNGQATGTLTNSASVSTPDENLGLPIISAPVVTTINALPNTAASLSVTKSAANNNAAVSAGGSETYTLTVTNHSSNAANNVTLLDVLPVGATFQSGTVTGGTGQTTLNSPTNGLETINLGTLAANASATVTMTVTAPSSVGPMVNTATVASTTGNTLVNNASASVATAVQGTTIPATGSVDLSITKSAAATASVGASQSETITVTNQGTANATGVVISDLLPAGVQFISGTTSVAGVNVTSSGSLASATLPTLAAGHSATITLTVTPSVTGALTDTAMAEADQLDANQANNIATATSLVNGLMTPAVNLSVTKSASATTGQVGANETYTITVSNNSANVATGVTVSDALPANATFVSASNASGNLLLPVGNLLTDHIGTLAANSSATLTVTVTPTAAGTITDTAYVSSDQVNTNLTHNIAALTTPVQGTTTANVDLSVTKSAANSNGNVTLGNNETYTITVTNNGTSPATGVVVSDVLPTTATFLNGTTSVSGVNVANANGTVSANLGTLNAGASATVTVTLTPTVAGSITDTAYVESNDIDVNQANNVAAVTTQVVSAATEANVSIAKIAVPGPDTVGQNLTYLVVVTNTGATAADNVSVSDVLPSAATFVSGSTDVSGVSVTNNNGTLSANLGTLAPGDVDLMTIVVTPTQAGTLSNTASVSTTSPNASTHTSSTVQTTINSSTSEANLSITKTASPSPGTVGQNVTYTIVVSDAAGAANAAGVTVSDVLPSGVNFVSAVDTTTNVSLTPVNGTITDNVGTVAAGASDTITVTVTPTQAGSLTNTASVATTTTNASTQTSATVQTTINSSTNEANLSISKTASPSPGAVNQNLTYTIVVTDAAGAADAAGVTVSDTLPAGVTFVSAQDTTRGVSLNPSQGTIVDNIGTVTAGSSDTITVTVTPTDTGTLTNTASVTTTTPNASNNTSVSVNTTINQAPPPGHSCYLNGQPGDGSDQTFLTNLYRELLNRNPDASGFQFWLNFLATNGGTTASGQSNAATRQSLVQTFLHSQEYVKNWVDCAYDTFLGRHADEDGEKFFVKELNNGGTEQQVIVQLLTSDEFFSHGHKREDEKDHDEPGNSNTAFVDNLYTQLLGRDADPTSEQAWVNALKTGQLTRAQVVQDFLASPEEAHDLLIANGAGSVGAPGTPAGGSYPLASVTGNGWDNLYFQGKLGTLNSSAVDQFMSEFETGTSWQTVQAQMLTLPQYYNA